MKFVRIVFSLVALLLFTVASRVYSQSDSICYQDGTATCDPDVMPNINDCPSDCKYITGISGYWSCVEDAAANPPVQVPKGASVNEYSTVNKSNIGYWDAEEASSNVPCYTTFFCDCDVDRPCRKYGELDSFQTVVPEFVDFETGNCPFSIDPTP